MQIDNVFQPVSAHKFTQIGFAERLADALQRQYPMETRILTPRVSFGAWMGSTGSQAWRELGTESQWWVE